MNAVRCRTRSVTERYTLKGEIPSPRFTDVNPLVDAIECEVCWALVSRRLMAFHREWHASAEGAGRRTFADPEPLEQHLAEAAWALSSLRSMPEASPRPEFVEDLRARLVAAAHARGARQGGLRPVGEPA